MTGPGRAAATTAAGLLLATTLAQAHPHGSMDCAATLGVQAGRLAWVELQLTLDGAASQALRPRVALHGDANAAPQAHNTNRVLWGLLRRGGWMLAVQAPGQPAPDWADHDSARLQLDAQGRLQVQVRLEPAQGVLLPAQALALQCRDPEWYWLAGFRHPGQITSRGARCEVSLGEMRSTRNEALALQAAAQQAGAPGADQMDPGLAQDEAPRAADAQLRCAEAAG